jgi:hypothetical protein
MRVPRRADSPGFPLLSHNRVYGKFDPSISAGNSNIPEKLSPPSGLTQNLAGRRSPKNSNFIFSEPAPDPRLTPGAPPELWRGIAFAFPAAGLLWLLTYWLIWGFG